MKRNQFIEVDGLVCEDERFEWFIDKTLTQHAHREVLDLDDALPHIFVFWTREKSTGIYEHVVFDNRKKELIHCDKFGNVGTFIDKLKVQKRFGIDKEIMIAEIVHEIKNKDNLDKSN